MNAQEVQKLAEADGIQFISIPGGKLKVRGGNSVVNKWLPEIKKHKAEIIRFLSKPPVEPDLKTCPICRGDDFTHGNHGGYFCNTCQPNARPGKQVKAGSRRTEQFDHYGERLDRPQTLSRPYRSKPRISPVALAWLNKHRQEFKQAGWASPELWRRNKSRGLAWLLIWDRAGVSVTLSGGGSIVFKYVNETGGAITQTAFPRRNNYGIRH